VTGISKLARTETEDGKKGETQLIASDAVALRAWDEGPTDKSQDHAHDYEVLGYAIEGEAELVSGDERLTLRPGDSWHVAPNTPHHYEVKAHFRAVEASSPPARSA
jgi:quercetin dioxygenase-like cupin family protein